MTDEEIIRAVTDWRWPPGEDREKLEDDFYLTDREAVTKILRIDWDPPGALSITESLAEVADHHERMKRKINGKRVYKAPERLTLLGE